MPLWLRTLTVSEACVPGTSESATGASAESSSGLRTVTMTLSATLAGTPVSAGLGSSSCSGAGPRTAATCTVGSQRV